MPGRPVRLLAVCTIALACICSQAGATIARFETTLGSIDVRLYDTSTPISVANFLNYVTANSWDGSFIHRSVPGFVVQGGGFSLTPDIWHTTNVTTFAPIQNEFGISNLRGTVAYAKLGGDPNSATSQWFFNLADNSANLDTQNGGFTVFARVVGTGMTVVDSIAALSYVNAGGAFTNVPVLDRNTVIAQQNIYNSDAVVVTNVFVRNLPDGDYNFDGVVNALDRTIWLTNYGSRTDAAADGNGNGIVDGRDFLLWQRTFGQTSLTAAIAAVPEPASLSLAVLACGLLLRRSPVSDRR